jgi:hypothetical protein
VTSFQRIRVALALLSIAWMATLAACSEEPEVPDLEPYREPPELPISPSDPHRYESQTLGFGISKPDDWVFLPISSLPIDGAARVHTREELWEVLRRPGLTPLVAMARRPERHPVADPGANPSVRVYARPLRPPDPESNSGVFGAIMGGTPPEKTIMANASWRGNNPDFELLEEPRPLPLSGHDAATVLMSYTLPSDEGPGRPVAERLWFVRRGPIYWYVEQVGPDPLPVELAEQFEAIMATVRLDP